MELQMFFGEEMLLANHILPIQTDCGVLLENIGFYTLNLESCKHVKGATACRGHCAHAAPAIAQEQLQEQIDDHIQNAAPGHNHEHNGDQLDESAVSPEDRVLLQNCHQKLMDIRSLAMRCGLI
jgi:hypothetical protein